MTRSKLREHCFKMLFCFDFCPTAQEARDRTKLYFDAVPEEDAGEDGAALVVHDVNMNDKDREYLSGRLTRIFDLVPELDQRLNQVAQGWKTGRMGKAELTILRLALFEMKYDEEIPEKVAINEAVELAKRFGDKDAPAFVNGILAKLV